MKRRYGTMISVDVDTVEVFSALDTDDLIEELRDRKGEALASLLGLPNVPVIIAEALAYLEAGDAQAAMHELRKAIKPHDPAKDYAAAREGRHPFLSMRPQ
jgi:hypothetical protein